MIDRNEELEHLISRRLDGTLSASELSEVSAALAADPRAEATARAYANLDRLLAGWRALPEGLDWSGFRSEVSHRITDESDLAATDRLLGNSAVRREAAAGHTLQFRPARPRRSSLEWFARVGAPLAAAAAIAIMTTAWLWRGVPKPPMPGQDPAQPIVVVELDTPSPSSQSAISFAFVETPVEPANPVEEDTDGSAFAFGPRADELAATQEEALFH
jgi:anti-sigma factor RsiW